MAQQILAGEAPAAVAGLRAEMRRDGVLLRWTAAPPEAAPAAVRLDRKLLTPPAKNSERRARWRRPPSRWSELCWSRQAQPRTALSTKTSASARRYEYRAQRVARVTVNGQTLELAGPLSAPVRIDAVNVFPPAVPRGLAAVATAGENGAGPAIDLSWQPDTEADLAGYIVYRREPAGETRAGSGFRPRSRWWGPAFMMPTSSPATPMSTP